MQNFFYCTLCLVTEVKLFKMSSAMYKTYNELISTQNKIKIEQMHACYECAFLLHKYEKFKSKCYMAYSILCSLSAGTFDIIAESLKSIDRKQNQLESKLTVASVSTDCHIIENNACNYTKFNDNNEMKAESVENNVEGKYNDVVYIDAATQPTYVEIPNFNNILLRENGLDFNYEPIKEELLIDNTQKSNIVCDAHFIDISEPDYSDNNLKEETIFTETKPVLEDNKKLRSKNSRGHVNKKDVESECDSDIDTDKDDNFDNEEHNDHNETELNEILARYPAPKEIFNENDADIIKPKKLKQEMKLRNSVSVKAKTNKKDKKITSKLKLIIDEIFSSRGNKKKDLKGKIKEKVCKTRQISFDRSFYENYATIIEMTPEEARHEVLLRKESLNFKESKYKCELCYRGFTAEGTYQSHMKKHSEEEGQFQCDICQIRASSKGDIRQHLTGCHRWKFVCKLCPNICYNTNQSRSHVFLHKGKKYSCDVCGQKFRFPNSVLSHKRLKHNLEVVCDLCGSMFGMESGLKAHKRKVHKREKNEYLGPKCEECDIHFSNERAWKRHLVLCSKHEVGYGCGTCGDTFPDAASLRKHGRGCSRKFLRPYKPPKPAVQPPAVGPCVYCNIPLEKRREYNKHMIKEHPDSEIAAKIMKAQNKTHVCEICGMAFKINLEDREIERLLLECDSGSEIVDHIETEDYDSDDSIVNPMFLPPSLYKDESSHIITHPSLQSDSSSTSSEISTSTRSLSSPETTTESLDLMCLKTVNDKANCFLRTHQRTHTGEKPFRCAECGKQFSCMSALKGHAPVHTHVYAYSCALCGKGFGFKSNYVRHMKYHSDERPYKCTGCDRRFPFLCEMRNHAKYVHNNVPWPKRDRSKRNLDVKEK